MRTSVSPAMPNPSSSAMPVVQPSEIRNSRSAVVIRSRSRAKFAVTRLFHLFGQGKDLLPPANALAKHLRALSALFVRAPVQDDLRRIPIHVQFRAKPVQRGLLFIVEPRCFQSTETFLGLGLNTIELIDILQDVRWIRIEQVIAGENGIQVYIGADRRQRFACLHVRVLKRGYTFLRISGAPPDGKRRGAND